jgi:hypothetical protein
MHGLWMNYGLMLDGRWIYSVLWIKGDEWWISVESMMDERLMGVESRLDE